MIRRFYSETELKKYKKVSDKELNNLLSQIREKDDRYFLKEKTITIERGWFRKPIQKKMYILLFYIRGSQCQIVKFYHQDRENDFDEIVSKAYIATFFLGWLNAYNSFLENQKYKI